MSDFRLTNTESMKRHTSSNERKNSLNKFVRRYEINNTFAKKLEQLDGYEIVFICDDSGSMNLPLNDVGGGYNDNQPTRWDEMRRTVSIVIDLANAFDPDGVDIYFLNRQPMYNVRSSQELVPMFECPPEGPTPIVRVLRQIFKEKHDAIKQKKLILLIATDGAPTDDEGHLQIKQLYNTLKYERGSDHPIPVTIIACTDDDDAMEYLNDWDNKLLNLDVVDDYKSEKKEILKCQGKNFPFSFGDYIVKILLGGIDSWFDQLDEVRVSTDEFGRPKLTQNTNNNNNNNNNNMYYSSYKPSQY